jgi:MinD-like ATPase involved in chromosome partitioning or flagellar assembly
MGFMNKLDKLNEYLSKVKNLEYRIINNTLGKNLILLSGEKKLIEDTKSFLLDNYDKYIQEIILLCESNEDDYFINEIKNICPLNSYIHRNISYLNWNSKPLVSDFDNIIAGYSFKGGMGRSTTLAYLAQFYHLMGKKVVILDCDFEAPGISNLFFEKKIRGCKLGIVDYLIDSNIEQQINLSDYYIKEVSAQGGELSLFSTGIDINYNDYISRLSKIDFNSNNYMNTFQKLLTQINLELTPDLIFIDLRAGINESNGFILKHISNYNFLFFNCEEQNEDGLKVILNSLKDVENNYIINSTIRYSTKKVELIEQKEKSFLNFLNDINTDIEVLPIRYKESMLETDLVEFKDFIQQEINSYSEDNKNTYLVDFINILSNKYSLFQREEVDVLDDVEFDLKNVLKKLESQFSKLIANQQFHKEEDLKFFYFKDDIHKLINEQIFLILGSKGTGKSSLFEIFTKNYKSLETNLNMKNNTYIAGFSEEISNNILSKDFLKLVFEKSKNEIENIERFWKFLTLYQIEQFLGINEAYFKSINKIKETFMDLEVGIEVDNRLKEININLYKEDSFITLVYDELDVKLTDQREYFIDGLVEFWRSSRNKFTQTKSKILLRNDIFSNLKIENKTHLELNIYELKWSKYEILSLILNIIVNTLNDEELKNIGLLNIVDKNNKLLKDHTKIRNAIFKIFGEKINETRSNISTMDNWIISYLSDGEGIVTPRVIYKFMSESIKKELECLIPPNSKILLPSLNENINEILYNVSNSKITEYNEEYKGYDKYYKKIQDIGYRIFEYNEFKETYTKKTKAETIKNEFSKLLDSGFIILKDEKKNIYQVANVYVPKLKLKMNRQGRRKE